MSDLDLSIARDLTRAGAPMFVAPPCTDTCNYLDHQPGEGHNGTGFHFPAGWQNVRPDPKVVDDWRPGDALCMVAGVLTDVLDKDVQNNGELGWRAMENALARDEGMPRVFGVARTPSGGEHSFISVTGLAKSNEGVPALGVDLQAKGSFVFLAPTVKRSKLTGEARPYVWVRPPDPEEILEWAGVDESIGSLVRRVTTMRAKGPEPRHEVAFDANPENSGRSGEWTQEQFQNVCRDALRDLEQTRQGEGFNATLNNVAMLMGHGVPEFWTEERARSIIEKSVLRSVNGWTALSGQDHRTIASGLSAGKKDPYRRIEAITEELTEATEEVKELSGVEKLLAKMLDRDALDALPDPEFLIEGILEKDSESWMIGASGSFKSFIALDMAGHVSNGMKWQGLPTAQGRVVYIVAEGSKNIKKRVRAWEATYGQRMNDVLILPEPVQVKGGTSTLDMTISPGWKVLVEACRTLNPVFIILDTQARMTVGLDENSNSQMGVYVEAVRLLKAATKACVFTLHHTGRNGGDARGASAIDGAQDHEIRVERVSTKKGDLRVVVSTDKNKDDAEDNEFKLQMRVVEVGQNATTGNPITSLAVDLVPFDSMEAEEVPEWRANLTANQSAVMYVMEELSDDAGLSLSQVMALLREHGKMQGDVKKIKSSAQSAIKSLKEKGGLMQVGARYYLPDFAPE